MQICEDCGEELTSSYLTFGISKGGIYYNGPGICDYCANIRLNNMPKDNKDNE